LPLSITGLVSDQVSETILGEDFLNSHAAIWDFANRIVTLDGVGCPLRTRGPRERCRRSIVTPDYALGLGRVVGCMDAADRHGVWDGDDVEGSVRIRRVNMVSGGVNGADGVMGSMAVGVGGIGETHGGFDNGTAGCRSPRRSRYSGSVGLRSVCRATAIIPSTCTSQGQMNKRRGVTSCQPGDCAGGCAPRRGLHRASSRRRRKRHRQRIWRQEDSDRKRRWSGVRPDTDVLPDVGRKMNDARLRHGIDGVSAQVVSRLPLPAAFMAERTSHRRQSSGPENHEDQEL